VHAPAGAGCPAVPAPAAPAAPPGLGPLPAALLPALPLPVGLAAPPLPAADRPAVATAFAPAAGLPEPASAGVPDDPAALVSAPLAPLDALACEPAVPAGEAVSELQALQSATTNDARRIVFTANEEVHRERRITRWNYSQRSRRVNPSPTAAVSVDGWLLDCDTGAQSPDVLSNSCAVALFPKVTKAAGITSGAEPPSHRTES
jgi:hypothetical protein